MVMENKLRYITVDEFLEGQSGVKVEIGPSTCCFKSEDHLLRYLIGIEQLIDGYICRRLDLHDTIDEFWGKNSRSHMFDTYPVESVESVCYISLSCQTPQIVDPSNYLVTKNSISFVSYTDSSIYYTITYKAGLDIIPEVLKQAIIEQAGLTLLEHQRGILESESGGNSKLKFVETPSDLYNQIKQKVRQFRKFNLFR